MCDEHYSDDPKEHKEKSKLGTFSPVFHFNEFKVGNLENASAINFGNNYPNNFRGYKRHSQGLGTIEGNHNDIHDLEASMSQRYLMDALVDRNEELPDWIKELVQQNQNEFMGSDEVQQEGKTNEINEIFEHIKDLLEVERVPLFFQKLAEKKDILRKVWTIVKENWNSSAEFNLFYYQLLERLNIIPLPTVTPSTPRIDQNQCKILADHIEETGKTLLIIIFLIKIYIPDYLEKFKEEKLKLSYDELNIQIDDQPNIQKVFSTIKAGFQLRELPPSFRMLRDYPDELNHAFFYIIQPITNSKFVDVFFDELKVLFIRTTEKMSSRIDENRLDGVEKSFLFTKLIDSLEQYPKYLILEYLILPLCDNDC